MYRLRARKSYAAPVIVDEARGDPFKLSPHTMLGRLRLRIGELVFLQWWDLSVAYQREYVVTKILQPAGWA